MSVGFADMVGYTRLSRRLPENELARLVQRFEAVSADIVAAGGGRLVKTVGDEVLFTATSADQAADIALRLHATHAGGRQRAGDARRAGHRTGALPHGRRLRHDGEPRQPADGDGQARRHAGGRRDEGAAARTIRATCCAASAGDRFAGSACCGRSCCPGAPAAGMTAARPAGPLRYGCGHRRSEVDVRAGQGRRREEVPRGQRPAREALRPRPHRATRRSRARSWRTGCTPT